MKKYVVSRFFSVVSYLCLFICGWQIGEEDYLLAGAMFLAGLMLFFVSRMTDELL